MDCSLNIKNFMNANISKASLKESLKIPDEDELAEILKVDISVGNIENKISYNKVLAKIPEIKKEPLPPQSSQTGTNQKNSSDNSYKVLYKPC